MVADPSQLFDLTGRALVTGGNRGLGKQMVLGLARSGGSPEEIVGTALYIASGASSYTTGAVITVDGGQP